MSNLTFAENYILDCIEENLEGETITEISDKVDYLKTRFYGEYGFMINRQGETTFSAAREWLLGLALNTHYTYDDIVTEYFDMDVDIMSEGEVYDYNDLYWNDLAEAVTSLVKNYQGVIDMTLADNVTLNKDRRTGLWVAAKGSKINTADNVIAIFITHTMKENGRYQIQLLKTRSRAGVLSREW